MAKYGDAVRAVRVENVERKHDQERRDWSEGSASAIIADIGAILQPVSTDFSSPGSGGVSVLNTLCLRNTAAIALADGVETDVTFDSLDWKGQAYNWSSAASKKVIFGYGNNGIEINGTVTFAANATGNRKFDIYFYNAADASLGSKTIFNVAPSPSGAAVIPFSFPIYLPALYPNTAYIQFTATQGSGGALNITYIVLSVYVIV